MKIENSSISMEANREFKKTETSSTMIQFWQTNPLVPQRDEVSFSEEGMRLAENDPAYTQHTDTVTNATEVEDELDLYLSDEDRFKIRLLEAFLSWFTRKKFKFDFIAFKERQGQEAQLRETKRPPAKQAGTGSQIQMPNWGFKFRHSETTHVSEKLEFKSSGKVKSTDGREIDFELNLRMERESHKHTSIEIKAGQALIDPIVIQTDTIPPGLSDKKIKFDLDLDGELDEMSVPRAGSGFLVFDRNENGKIDDGSELFGPQSGHGFSELRALDSDGNGWLDENDAAFSKLQIWSMDDEGQMQLTGLLEADVGAIYLSTASTEYELTDSEFEQNGQLRESGIYLKESGGVSSIHELDILV